VDSDDEVSDPVQATLRSASVLSPEQMAVVGQAINLLTSDELKQFVERCSKVKSRKIRAGKAKALPDELTDQGDDFFMSAAEDVENDGDIESEEGQQPSKETDRPPAHQEESPEPQALSKDPTPRSVDPVPVVGSPYHLIAVPVPRIARIRILLPVHLVIVILIRTSLDRLLPLCQVVILQITEVGVMAIKTKRRRKSQRRIS
jgi:hypothetical protein